MRFILSVLALCVVVQPVVAGTLSWVTQERWVTVKSVTDGDTFKTTQGEKVRLLGINTPETRKDTKPAQPFGNAAKKALIRLIDGKQVRLSFDKEKKDRYGRTLAHIYTRDGLWVNAELVKQGLAHVYTFAPNMKAAKKLTNIESKVIRDNIGMWANSRWKVLTPKALNQKVLGQFRLIHGTLIKGNNSSWRIQLGKLAVTVPRKYRQWFGRGLTFKVGDSILVRGRLRLSKKGQWFLSVHTPSDIVRYASL